ncbi:MAG: hypothetical protein EHM36_10560 [Deltaproteobacteria bacterium]|nr:MAG: hypothetical protein EHM36_10560 [Deltaproteobacteria bacterium]
MTARLTGTLKAWLRNRKAISHYVFPSPDDPTVPMLTGSKFGFETAVTRAEIGEDVHFHDLRRTGATRWAERGGSMKVLQEILNHADINITAKIYTQVSGDFKRQEMEKVENGQAK